jgi:5'-phosphate synthase pdxT subunit
VVTAVRGSAQVLARLEDGRIVAVQEGRWLATAFHPELTADSRLHRFFVQMVAQQAGKKG